MPTINTRGADIWYDVAGSGPPLVLTGGYGLMHNQYDRITPFLAKSYTVVNWNHRGAGKSSRAWPQPFTLDDWVDDMAAVLAHLKMDKVFMLGLSYGGLFCIRAATRWPKLVRAMIVSPNSGSTAGPRLSRMQDVILGLVETIGFDGFAVLVQLIDSADQNQMRGDCGGQARYIAEALKANLTLGALAKIMDVFNQVDLHEDVAKVLVPIGVLVGDSGRGAASKAPMAQVIEAFVALCRNAEVLRIPNAGGTFTVVEKPEETAAAIHAFLGKA